MAMWQQLTAIKQVEAASLSENELDRSLGPWALTALGIGAIIGTGIFVLTGVAAANNAGPALMLSFVVAGVVCGLAALCYAEFASLIPASGSAYSYAYSTMGELLAWFIGWDLILEYLVSIGAVAVGWAGYFTAFLRHFGIVFPEALRAAPLAKGVGAIAIVPTGHLMNLPAMLIVAAITALCYFGIRQSSKVNAWIVVLKLAVIVLFIGFGAYYIVPANWHPFIPERIVDATGPHYGVLGIFEGAAIIFFAYIGFDAVSTAAQEAKNPQRDMPIGIIASLIICTVLYIIVAGILTGMIPYGQLNVSHPVAYAVEQVPALKNWLAPIIEIGAILGLSSVILVMMIGQPRIFYAMAKDGLFPPVFAKVHPKYKTPHINTLITGAIATVMAGVLPIDILAEMTNIGTLSAFFVVCIAVLILRHTRPDLKRSFSVPLPWFTCLAGAGGCAYLIYSLPVDTWIRMIGWAVLGFIIYFAYGFRHSRLRSPAP